MTNSKSIFVRTKSGVKNLALATTVILSDGRLVILDDQCNLVHYMKGEGVDSLFQRISKLVKPIKSNSLFLENGSWVNVDIIGDVYISDKSNSLIISSVEKDNLLAIFTPEEYSDLEGLRNILVEALCDFSEGKPIPELKWSEHKA